jgi:ATP synthase protein I
VAYCATGSPLVAVTVVQPSGASTMLASYATVLRRSAMITAPAALVMVGLAAFFGGTGGLLGGLVAVGLVAAFFGASTLVVSWVGRHKPGAVLAAAVGTYVVKIVLLLVFVATLSGTTAFNGRIFGLTAVGCVLVWSAAQAVTSIRLKVPYVEPARPPAAPLPGPPPGGER